MSEQGLLFSWGRLPLLCFPGSTNSSDQAVGPVRVPGGRRPKIARQEEPSTSWSASEGGLCGKPSRRYRCAQWAKIAGTSQYTYIHPTSGVPLAAHMGPRAREAAARHELRCRQSATTADRLLNATTLDTSIFPCKSTLCLLLLVRRWAARARPGAAASIDPSLPASFDTTRVPGPASAGQTGACARWTVDKKILEIIGEPCSHFASHAF